MRSARKVRDQNALRLEELEKQNEMLMAGSRSEEPFEEGIEMLWAKQ